MKLIDKDALVQYLTGMAESACCDKNVERIIRKFIIPHIDTLEVKEVDFKLTLEDVSMIRQIMFDYNRQVRNEMSIPNDEEYCKEVLKRFKAQKGE